ncbi:hypothetical protein A0256_08730 [Mucilaginibacter sp. PAMC 26640]|nr:hypothetical protein A0256_08730 [Mucilaginibacter sp. PAMC 26640]
MIAQILKEASHCLNETKKLAKNVGLGLNGTLRITGRYRQRPKINSCSKKYGALGDHLIFKDVQNF